MANNINVNVGAAGLSQSIQQQVNQAQQAINRRPLQLKLDAKGFRQPLGRITGDINEFQKSLDASVARTFAFGAAVGVVNQVNQAFKALVTTTIEVQKELANINVLLGATSADLAKFSTQLFGVAKNTAQTFRTVAEAATEFSRQGLSAEQTLRRVEDAMILTRLSGLSATQSVEALTAAVNGFRKEAITSTEVINRLANVDAAFAVSSKDLADALARAGSTAQGAKVEFNELLAAVTSVQQQTARGGAVIGNAFKSIFTRIQRSGVQDALNEIGVATRNADGSFRSGIQVIKDYAAVYNTLTDAQKAYTSEQIAGVFQINNLKALVNDLNSEYSIYNRALATANNSTDQATRRNEELNKTLAALLAQTAISAQQLAAAIGSIAAQPAIERVLKIIGSIADFFTNALDPEKGSKLAKGFLSGIGSFIAGPGLVIVGGAFLKLFAFISKQASGALREIFNINTETARQQQLQQGILALVTSEESVYRQIVANAGNQAAQEQVILNALRQQTAERAKQQQFLANIAASPAFRGLEVRGGAIERRAGRRGRGAPIAGGHIPVFANTDEVMVRDFAASAEADAIRRGVGGARPTARVVKTSINPQRDAIFNRDMIASMGMPAGAQRIAAQGFIPNFQAGKKNKKNDPQDPIPINTSGGVVLTPTIGEKSERALKPYTDPKTGLQFTFTGGTKILGPQKGMGENALAQTMQSGQAQSFLKSYLSVVTQDYFKRIRVGKGRPLNLSDNFPDVKRVTNEFLTSGAKGYIFEEIIKSIQGDIREEGFVDKNPAFDVNPRALATPELTNLVLAGGAAVRARKIELKSGSFSGGDLATKYVNDILQNLTTPGTSVDPMAAERVKRTRGGKAAFTDLRRKDLAQKKRALPRGALAGGAPNIAGGRLEFLRKGSAIFAISQRPGGRVQYKQFNPNARGKENPFSKTQKNNLLQAEQIAFASLSQSQQLAAQKQFSLASGFIPNFAAIDPLARAVNTERKFGGNPVVDFDPRVGTFVRDKNKQANLSQAVAQHGGLAQALSDSRQMQGLAGGFIPNFQTAGASDTGLKGFIKSGPGLSFAITQALSIALSVIPTNKLAGPLQDVLGGAISGASLGALGGPVAAAIGAAIGAAVPLVVRAFDPVKISSEELAKTLENLNAEQKKVTEGIDAFANAQANLRTAVKQGDIEGTQKAINETASILAELPANVAAEAIGTIGKDSKAINRVAAKFGGPTPEQQFADLQLGFVTASETKGAEKTRNLQKGVKGLVNLLKDTGKLDTAQIKRITGLNTFTPNFKLLLRDLKKNGQLTEAEFNNLIKSIDPKDFKEASELIKKEADKIDLAKTLRKIITPLKKAEFDVDREFATLAKTIETRTALLTSRFEALSGALKTLSDGATDLFVSEGIISQREGIQRKAVTSEQEIRAAAEQQRIALEAKNAAERGLEEQKELQKELTELNVKEDESLQELKANTQAQLELLTITEAVKANTKLTSSLLSQADFKPLSKLDQIVKPAGTRQQAQTGINIIESTKNLEELISGLDLSGVRAQAQQSVLPFNLAQIVQGVTGGAVQVDAKGGIDSVIRQIETSIGGLPAATQQLVTQIVDAFKKQQEVAKDPQKALNDSLNKIGALFDVDLSGSGDKFKAAVEGLNKGEQAIVGSIAGLNKQFTKLDGSIDTLNSTADLIKQSTNNIAQANQALAEAQKQYAENLANVEQVLRERVTTPQTTTTTTTTTTAAARPSDPRLSTQFSGFPGTGSATKASGFVPSFSPLSRAVNTERSLGGSPVVDYHPRVGTYVRDGNTQRNFNDVIKSHPEGLNQAVKNSKTLQGSNAKGFVPNFKVNLLSFASFFDAISKPFTPFFNNAGGGSNKQSGSIPPPPTAASRGGPEVSISQRAADEKAGKFFKKSVGPNQISAFTNSIRDPLYINLRNNLPNGRVDDFTNLDAYRTNFIGRPLGDFKRFYANASIFERDQFARKMYSGVPARQKLNQYSAQAPNFLDEFIKKEVFQGDKNLIPFVDEFKQNDRVKGIPAFTPDSIRSVLSFIQASNKELARAAKQYERQKGKDIAGIEAGLNKDLVSVELFRSALAGKEGLNLAQIGERATRQVSGIQGRQAQTNYDLGSNQQKAAILLGLIGSGQRADNPKLKEILNTYGAADQYNNDAPLYKLVKSIKDGSLATLYARSDENTRAKFILPRIKELVNKNGELLLPGTGNYAFTNKNNIASALGLNTAALDELLKNIGAQGAVGAPGARGGLNVLGAATSARRAAGQLFVDDDQFRIAGPTSFRFGKGFIPNFSALGEIAASVGAGYKNPVTASQVRSTNIPGLGKVNYNTQESIVRAPGMQQPFIVPPRNSRVAPDYARKVESKFGFNPYKSGLAAGGFVPNFQGLPNMDFTKFSESVTQFGQDVDRFAEAMNKTLEGQLNVNVDTATTVDSAAIRDAVQNGVINAVTNYFTSGPGVQNIVDLSQQVFNQNLG